MIPLLLWLIAVPAHADPLVDGLVAEAERTRDELRLGDADPAYFVAFDLVDVHRTSVSASLGGVVGRGSEPRRSVGVAVRVGTPEVDSANFDDSWSGDGFRWRAATLGDDPFSLRHTAWYEADRAYKEAVENLARREAARARMAKVSDVPCFAPGEARVAEQPAAAPVPLESLEPVTVALSKVFLDHPRIEWSRVFAEAERGRRVVVDTNGTRVENAVSVVTVRATARVRAEDGTWITDHRTWIVRDPEDLPKLERMVARTEGMADRLEAWADAPLVDEDYVGPVVFEDAAAVELVRQLLLPALEGTPPKETAPKGSRALVVHTDEAGSAVRVKRRLLPSGFHVIDDPTDNPRLPSSFTYDDEGAAAERIKLVADGVIRTHYASRTPSEQVPRSNGHARGSQGELLRGRAANTRLEADRMLSAKKLHKTAMDAAADYDLDHYVVVRRIEDEAVSSTGSKVAVEFFGDDSGPLGQPVEVVRVYADGREELVRGWSFVGIDHRLLRDVLAAGPDTHQATVLQAPWRGRSAPLLGGLPTTVSTPTLLVGEVELQAGGGVGEKPPQLPSPLADGG